LCIRARAAPAPAAGSPPPIQRVILKKDGKPYKVLNSGTGTWSALDVGEKAHLATLHQHKKQYTVDEAITEAQSRASSGPPTKKRKLPAPHPFNAATDYSDSEDEAERSGNTFAKKWGTRGHKAVINYTKQGQGAYRAGTKKKGMRKKVDNYVDPKDNATAAASLEDDAKQIHDVIPKTDVTGTANRTYGATTITTSLEKHRKTGLLKKFAFTNTDLMPPGLRDEAEGLGYHVVKAQKSHAEGEKIQYDAAREGVYEHEDMGTDKEHCEECEWAMGQTYGSGVQTQTGYSGKRFKKWHNPEALQEALGLTSAATPYRTKKGAPK
jgi:hypothetical protein